MILLHIPQDVRLIWIDIDLPVRVFFDGNFAESAVIPGFMPLPAAKEHKKHSLAPSKI